MYMPQVSQCYVGLFELQPMYLLFFQYRIGLLHPLTLSLNARHLVEDHVLVTALGSRRAVASMLAIAQ